MQPFSKVVRSLALACMLATLAGCAEYLDRRDAISFGAGDAIASDRVTQMVDPWPLAAANKNIAFNGEKMQSAVERYRTNRVYSPSGKDSNQAGPAPAAPAPVGPTVTQGSAPVK
jgi:hypothetical protein